VAIGPGGVTLDGERVDVEFTSVFGDAVSGRWVVRIDDQAHAIGYQYRPPHPTNVDAVPNWDLSLKGSAIEAEVLDDRQATIRELVGATLAARGPQPIKASMPGLVVKVDVREGDTVEPGQGVVVVEAMKMENELLAQSHAIVQKIHVAPGQPVQRDQVLVEFATAATGDKGG